MDTITHGLLGAVTSQLGFRQRIGRDAAWVAGLAAACLDLDIFVQPAMRLLGIDVDEFTGIRTHRGITHSLLMIPIYSLILAGIWMWARRQWYRRKPGNGDANTNGGANGRCGFWLLYLCVLPAMLSHPLLDACTSYGTQLFEPLTDLRVAWDNVPIVDIFFTPILILTLLACWIARKVARGRTPPADAPAAVAKRATLAIGWTGFLLACGYLLAGWQLHNWAVDKGLAIASQRDMLQGQNVLSADAYPMTGSIFLWRVVVKTDRQWLAMRIHCFAKSYDSVQPQSAQRVDNEWVRKARELPEVQTFEWFTMGHARAQYERLPGRHVVEFRDMRYGRTANDMGGMWFYRVSFDDETGKLLEHDFSHGMRGGDRGDMIRSSWHDIWNP